MQKLKIRALPVNFDTLAVHEKEWMKTWDEKVRGRGAASGAE
jgi:hypothetical protein